MLPMFHYAQEVEIFCKMVAGRAGVIPLVETPQAAMRIDELVKVEGVSEIYIGLNDLHLGLGLDFMFETLTNGFVEHMALQIKAAGLPFGFGGVARIGEGLCQARWCWPSMCVWALPQSFSRVPSMEAARLLRNCV